MESHPDLVGDNISSSAEAFPAPAERESWGLALTWSPAPDSEGNTLATLQIGPLPDWPARTKTLTLLLPDRERAVERFALGCTHPATPEDPGDGLPARHGLWAFDDSALSSAHILHHFTTVAPRWRPGEPVPPEIRITGPATDSRFSVPASIRLAAEIQESVATIVEVSFYEDDILLGIDTEAPYEALWRVSGTGPRFLTARATDTLGQTGVSQTRIVVLVEPESAPGPGPDPSPNGLIIVGAPGGPGPGNPFRPFPPGGGGGGSNPGESSAPEDENGDLDLDGLPNGEDWVPYDPRLDAWGPTGVPRFAVIETGNFIPWRSNKHGMVLGYVGSGPTVDAVWHVWYQGEWNPNKLDLSKFDVTDATLNSLPVLSQEHPVVFGSASGTRALGCKSEDRSVTLGYAFTPEKKFVVLEEATPSDAHTGTMASGMQITGVNANGFTGSVSAVETDGSGDECKETYRYGAAIWSFAGNVSAQWNGPEPDPDPNPDPGGDPSDPTDLRCSPKKVSEEPPGSEDPAAKKPSDPTHFMIGPVKATTTWTLCKENNPPGGPGPDPAAYAEAWREAAVAHNKTVDVWKEGDECPKFQAPTGGGGKSVPLEVEMPASGEYLYNGQTQPAVTHSQLSDMPLALSDPVVHPTSPPLLVVTKGQWKQGPKQLNSNCFCNPGIFSRERRLLWMTHDGKNELVELRNGDGGLIDVGSFVEAGAAGDERTFPVGENGTGGLWADGYVHPWEELTGGKSISLWNWYVGRKGLSCAKRGNVGAILVPMEEVTPDYNRDGLIDDKDKGKVAEDNPLRWWVNDDNDDGEFGSDDTPSDGSEDGKNTPAWIDGIRDLVDFFPLHLDIKNLIEIFPPEDFRYLVANQDNAFNIAETELEANTDDENLKSSAYIRNLTVARTFDQATTHQQTVKGAHLSSDFLNRITDNPDAGIILIEGKEETANPLRLIVEDRESRNDVIDVEILPVRISDVEKMYRHVDLRDLRKSRNGADAPGNVLSFPGRERTGNPQHPYPDDLTNGKYFAFIHGFNVDEKKARGWHAEIFKRLHQMGSRARFIGISWNGNTGEIAGNSTNYHQAVFNAFQTGDALAGKLGFATADLTIAAHSLGNVVVSHAIADGGFEPTRYYMINAASPLEAYTNPITATQQIAMVEESWEEYGAMQRIMAARWYQLFEDGDDSRSDLRWKDRFASVITKAYNFYSTGEDVVQNPETNSANLAASTWGNGPLWNGRGAWANQEFIKGTSYIASLAMEPRQAGWGFDERFYQFEPTGNGSGYDRLVKPDLITAAEYTDQYLRENPVFGEILESGLTHPQNGSSLAANPLVKYHVLAGGVQALSYAAAANPLPFARGDFDMQTEFKTNQEWPSEGHFGFRKSGNWLHSDFRNVALSYVHGMYSRMIELGGLEIE